jgi:hypothetical protein
MTPRRAPIEPTRPRPSQWTSHGQDLTRLSHFSWFAQPFWIKHQLFLSFYQSFCYIVATVLSHFKELVIFSLIQWTQSFFLQCSITFCFCYSKLIYFFYSVSHFFIATGTQTFYYTEFSHFINLSIIHGSHFTTVFNHFLNCSIILKIVT